MVYIGDINLINDLLICQIITEIHLTLFILQKV